MSSHIMSDVEKVCQRVAVIRQGELVTVEEVEKLREKAGQRVTVEFGDTVAPEELARIPGVSMVSKNNNNSSYHFNINCICTGNSNSVSREETMTHSRAGWRCTPHLPLWANRGESRPSKKRDLAGPAIGMPIGRKIDTRANAIWDLQPG
jgi:ABC-type multidrug transport system ATPase subunit